MNHPLVTALQRPQGRDVRFILLTVLVLAVVFNFGFAIYRLWATLLTNRYAPAPLVILIALPIALGYFWVKISDDRSELQRRALSGSIDPDVSAIALRALYRGLFVTAMVALLLLAALHQLVLTK